MRYLYIFCGLVSYIIIKTKSCLLCFNLNIIRKLTFQGMVVAILFCFMNSEVIGQLKRFVNLSMGGPNQPGQSIAMTQYTVKLMDIIYYVNSSLFQLCNHCIRSHTYRIYRYMSHILCRIYNDVAYIMVPHIFLIT